LKIDIFNHVLPKPYLDALQRHAGDHSVVRYAAAIRPLWDIDERLRLLEPWPEVMQVLTLGQPSPEMVAPPDLAPQLARLANDGMARIRDERPGRFPAFVASLPMNNVEAALEEMDRAVGKLGAAGIQVLTNINGKPLDAPELFPIFERIAKHYRLPVWMHPYRPPTIADYVTESRSEYEIWAVLNWPHETSVAMTRLVFSELLDNLPDLKVITHHCGGTVPYLSGRISHLWENLGSFTGEQRYRDIRQRMAEKRVRPIDYFRRFYADTVLAGSTAALRCGIDFFGHEHVVFGTDFPYGPESGLCFMRETIRMLGEAELSGMERDRIYFGNALTLVSPRSAA
jgi:aminocarboxymuconate-semialdehyde decarboxylase